MKIEPCPPNFSLECYDCDAGMDIRSHRNAELRGWSYIIFDDGPAWNYLGLCPECKREREQAETKTA